MEQNTELSRSSLDLAIPIRPNMFKVVMYYIGDFPTQGETLYESTLRQFFNKDVKTAHMIYQQARLIGSAVAGVYTKDVAETKVAMARNNLRQLDPTAHKIIDLEGE